MLACCTLFFNNVLIAPSLRSEVIVSFHWETTRWILKEDPSYFSPVSCLNYEYYEKLECVTKTILNDSDKIQCIVSNLDFPKSISLGTTQNPKLWEYADGKDTIDFILNS